MNKSTGILLALLGLFLGIIIGFMWAPTKKGIHCGNDSGNTYIFKGSEDDFMDEEDNCDDEDSLGL